MKIKLIVLLQLMLLSFSFSVDAQKGEAKITGIYQQNDKVEITITCSKIFREGASPYVLHIGDKVFLKSYHPQKNNANTLIFIIPAVDFNALPNGTEVTLVRGYTLENKLISSGKNQDPRKKYTGTFWKLGKLDTQTLNKK